MLHAREAKRGCTQSRNASVHRSAQLAPNESWEVSSLTAKKRQGTPATSNVSSTREAVASKIAIHQQRGRKMPASDVVSLTSSVASTAAQAFISLPPSETHRSGHGVTTPRKLTRFASRKGAIRRPPSHVTRGGLSGGPPRVASGLPERHPPTRPRSTRTAAAHARPSFPFGGAKFYEAPVRTTWRRFRCPAVGDSHNARRTTARPASKGPTTGTKR